MNKTSGIAKCFKNDTKCYTYNNKFLLIDR